MSKVRVKELVDQANAEITVFTPGEVLEMGNKSVLIDIRDVRELAKEGKITGSVHAPRGMLEFWFDAESPYHREIFADESKTYVLFCAMGWRSALATKTLKDMGFENVAHVDGGFAALKEIGAEIEEYKLRT